MGTKLDETVPPRNESQICLTTIFALLLSESRKRRAVLQCLRDPTVQPQSNRAIARRCGVDHKTVGKFRKALSGDIPQMHRLVRRGKTSFMMDITNIGRTRHLQPSMATSFLTGEVLLALGVSPAAAQRIHARLASMSAVQRQQAIRLLQTLLL